MSFTKMSGRSMHSVSVGLVCLAIASTICCSTVGGSHNITCLESERRALVQFQQALVDESNALASWKSEKDCCKWRGISCNPQTGHVTHLNFSFSYDPYSYSYTGVIPLRGEISGSLLELGYLNYLDLSYNDFGGMMIPKFIGSLGQLKELRLAGANFSGHVPPQLGNLSNLHTLDLSLNFDVKSENLEWLSHLSSLRYLDMSYVNLSKVVNWPQSLSKLTSLRELKLSHCYLSDVNPKSLSSINSSTSLQLLDLSYNSLTNSSIFYWIANVSTNFVHLDLSNNYVTHVNSENLEWLSHLSSLRYLDMSYVNLSKVVNWPQSLSKLTSLRELKLSHCYLSDVNPKSLFSINSSTSLQLLDLSFNYLTFLIFYWISNVSTNFVHLDLSFNNLKGPIPDVFTSMLSLATLDLSYNQLEGGIPKSFQNLCSLESLVLWENDFSGNIDDSLKSLSCAQNTLETLELWGNQFWGSLAEMKPFTKLRVLDLSWNTLNGSLSESVGQLSCLETLYLFENSMSGVITESHFLNLSRLQSLHLSHNHFSINLSSDLNPPFQLVELGMSSCKVGPAFPNWILKHTNLTYLYLSNAGLSGSLPNEFWDLFPGLDELDLSMNKIHGKLPNLSKTRLGYVDLSSNLLVGAVPSFSPELYYLYLDLSNNMFSELGSSFCATLNDLRLSVLDLSGNLLSGELPNCLMKFHGFSLNLGRNQLSGRIPSWLGNLTGIGILRLHGNQFSGELPSLENCTGLVLLDVGDNNLSGKIPTWIGQSLTNLEVLRLRSNKFSGILPFSMCSLAAIHVLDLSHNNISGGLPHCFNNIISLASYNSFNGSLFFVDVVWKGIEIEFGENLEGMRSIDISSNYLSGEIPQSIASMTELISLNLSRNCLNGKLPENFGDMKMLESLDLSRNKISGNIPASIASLNFLSVLDLSRNNLSGRIPVSTQLQSFNASAYMGNFGLCGPPLIQSCPGDETTTQEDETDNKEHGSHISLGLVISTTLGFITGFWVVCGSLLLKSSWRYAYFKFCDDSWDWVYVKAAVYKAKIQRKFQR